MSLKIAGRAIDAWQRGDLKQAAKLFDQCHKKLSQPNHMHACAETYFKVGRYSDAQVILKKLLKQVNITPQIMSLSGDINKATGKLDAAVKDYRQAVTMAPKTPELHYNLALALFANSNIVEAKVALGRALKIRPDYVKALVLLGRCLAATEQFDDAQQAFTKAITIEPNNYLPHYRLGRLHVYKGNSAKATESLGASLDINQQLMPAQEALVLNSIYSGEHQTTADLIEASLRIAPNNESILAIATDWAIENKQDNPYHYYDKAWQNRPTANLFKDFINSLILSSDSSRAEILMADYEASIGKDLAWESAKLKILETQGHYEEMISLIKSSPRRSKHQMYNCLAHFALGHYGTSYDCAQKLHHSQPSNQYYLALLTTALRCLGDKRYDQLADYNKLILQANLDTQFENSPRFRDFKTDLIAHLNQLHVTRRAPLQQSVRGGTQTPGNLFAQSKSPLIHSLKHSIADVSQPFFSRLKSAGLNESHPIITAFPDTPYFHASWSIRTAEGGFHKSHIHSKGWYSSACYIDVPEVINDESDAGYLVLGKPPFKTKDELEPDYSIKPKAGSLILFPSYVWHATQSYQGKGNRLVVAFDVGAPNLFV
ncbi:MAG: tetratricopeptide (TPR) repeat protein [Porticoccaceae bacterium]|jgi:tetratricopeptide (TPR) repeat protein